MNPWTKNAVQEAKQGPETHQSETWPTLSAQEPAAKETAPVEAAAELKFPKLKKNNWKKLEVEVAPLSKPRTRAVSSTHTNKKRQGRTRSHFNQSDHQDLTQAQIVKLWVVYQMYLRSTSSN